MNRILNGDFSLGFDYWDNGIGGYAYTLVSGRATATSFPDSGNLKTYIMKQSFSLNDEVVSATITIAAQWACAAVGTEQDGVVKFKVELEKPDTSKVTLYEATKTNEDGAAWILNLGNVAAHFTQYGNYKLWFTCQVSSCIFISGPTTQGYYSPGTVVDDSAVGTVPWNTPNNAKSSNNVYTFVGAPPFDPATSHYLKATNFGFSVPDGATIDGIVVQIERKPNAASKVSDSRVHIVKWTGAIGATNKKKAGYWSTTETYYTYGLSSDKWGETWTPARINDADFGVVLSVVCQPMGLASVDHIRIMVFYTVPPTYGESIGNYDNINLDIAVKKYKTVHERMGGVEAYSPHQSRQSITTSDIMALKEDYSVKVSKVVAEQIGMVESYSTKVSPCQFSSASDIMGLHESYSIMKKQFRSVAESIGLVERLQAKRTQGNVVTTFTIQDLTQWNDVPPTVTPWVKTKIEIPQK